MIGRGFDDRLRYHKEELRNALVKVNERIGKYRPGFKHKKYPLRFAKLYWHALRGEKIPMSVLTSDWDGGASLRTVHDFYGWMAKGSVEKLGLCSGALYRSARFLDMPLAARCGRRGEQTVHIEHTVPVNVLFRALKNEITRLESLIALHEFLISYSICTALHFEEKKLLDQAGVDSRRHPAFDDHGRRIAELPFMRYEKLVQRDRIFRIFNVVTGTEVEIDKFTFADHIESLTAASRLVVPDACGIGIYCVGTFKAI